MRTLVRKPGTAQRLTSATPMMVGRARPSEIGASEPRAAFQSSIRTQAEKEAHAGASEGNSIHPTGPLLDHDFSRIPIYPPVTGAIQTKLAINAPGDGYERVAERVADKMMSLPQPRVQRSCTCDGGCPRCGDNQARHEQIQSKAVRGGSVGEVTAPPSVEKVLSSPGQPLAASARAFFEPRFGHDFGGVRLHTGPLAAESAAAVNAEAYTAGSHIVFRQHEAAPTTRAGLHLLAHELTHVVQQGAARPALLQRRPSPRATNYRFDTYRVTAADLSDPDMVARFESLPLIYLIKYRTRTPDPAVSDYIDRLLDDRLRARTFDQLFAELATENDAAVRNYIDQWLATHAPTSYEIALGTNKPGETVTAMDASGIAVTVLPDEFIDEAAFESLLEKTAHGHASDTTRGITLFDPKWQARWVPAGQKVGAIRPTIQQLRIKTVYLAGTSRVTPSGYGVGTRKQDVKSGRTTLAHHEGSHATCFVQFLRNNPPPTFTGKKGDTVTAINEKDQTFQTAMAGYYERMRALCGPSVDCTGTKASFCP